MKLEKASGGHLVQPLVPRRGNLDQIAQDLFQSSFEYLQGWRLYNLSGGLVQGLPSLLVKKAQVYKSSSPW